MPESRRRPGLRRPRILWALACCGLAAATPSCAEVGLGGATQTKPNPSATAGTTPTPRPGQTGLSGGVGDETGSATSPKPSVTPAGASPTPSATPTVREGASTVAIFPASVKLSVPPGGGAGPAAGYESSIQLRAVVTMVDGSTSSAVVWRSLVPAIATVDGASGLVTVLGPGAGSGPWTVGIEAKSQDGNASDVRLISVSAAGEVAVSVQ